MSHRDIIVIGASAGGIEALLEIARSLPDDLPAAIFVTVHFPEHGTSVLPRILTKAGRLPATHATDGEAISLGRIYVAPPDFHLLLDRDHVHLVRGPRENGNRPAVDPMFRSAALAFGPRVIGVVLTGNLDDGTSGLAAIKRRGGVAVVQDPADALFPSMPQSALEHIAVDHVVELGSVGSTLATLVSEPLVDAAPPRTSDDVMEEDYSAADLRAIENVERHPGKPSTFGCPDCGGVLWEITDDTFIRYRCRIGHAWTRDALLGKQADSVDDALWTAVRTLEENASLARQIASRHRTRGADGLAHRFVVRAETTEARVRVIRELLMQHRAAPVNPDAEVVTEPAG